MEAQKPTIHVGETLHRQRQSRQLGPRVMVRVPSSVPSFPLVSPAIPRVVATWTRAQRRQISTAQTAVARRRYKRHLSVLVIALKAPVTLGLSFGGVVIRFQVGFTMLTAWIREAGSGICPSLISSRPLPLIRSGIHLYKPSISYVRRITIEQISLHQHLRVES